MPNYLKIGLLAGVSSFLAYSIFWAAYSVFWVFRLTTTLIPMMETINLSSLHQNIILVQEYSASAGYFLALIGAVFAVLSIRQFVKNQERYRHNLGLALVFEAAFFLTLIPSSIHHLLGVALSWTFVDVLVGISFLLQVCLIVPPLIIIGRNIGKPQRQNSVLKWIAIGMSLVVWAFWFKYLFLWIDALLPLGPKQANLPVIVGGINSVLTLLVASVLATVSCIAFFQQRKINNRLVGAALLSLGGYFAIYDLVSLWVPVYNSFLYLTDFWMIALLITGGTILKAKPNNIEKH